jgi:hypothetical protein
MKTCNKCKVVKEFSGFSKNKWAKDGYSYQCRDCDKQKHKLYFIENKDKIKKRIQDRKARDIEHYKEINNKYYARNKDYVLEKQKTYRTENKSLVDLRFKIQVDDLGDRYVKQLLKRQFSLITVPPEFIEAKRNLILIQRELRAKK